MEPGRDYWWHDLMADASSDCDPYEVDSEHPLFILYTSGSTGKPKGVKRPLTGLDPDAVNPGAVGFFWFQDDQ